MHTFLFVIIFITRNRVQYTCMCTPLKIFFSAVVGFKIFNSRVLSTPDEIQYVFNVLRYYCADQKEGPYQTVTRILGFFFFLFFRQPNAVSLIESVLRIIRIYYNNACRSTFGSRVA